MEEINTQLEEALASWDDDFDTPVEVEETDEETTETDTDLEESSEEATNVEESTDSKEQAFTLKHFSGDRDVTLEEMQGLAQKGLDYDRVKQQVQDLRSDARLGVADKIQKLADLYKFENIDKFVEGLYQSYDQHQAEEENVTPDVIKQKRELADKHQKADEKLSEIEKKESRDRQFKEFTDKYKDVDIKTISNETWQKFEKGLSLVEAYEQQIKTERMNAIEQELATLKEENALLKKQQEVASKNPVGSLGQGNVDTVPDYLKLWDED